MPSLLICMYGTSLSWKYSRSLLLLRRTACLYYAHHTWLSPGMLLHRQRLMLLFILSGYVYAGFHFDYVTEPPLD
jgi:hypothetical protein